MRSSAAMWDMGVASGGRVSLGDGVNCAVKA
jgi:hypothetical protein